MIKYYLVYFYFAIGRDSQKNREIPLRTLDDDDVGSLAGLALVCVGSRCIL